MRPLTLLFCVWTLLSPALWAAPANDFIARGKELLANKEKLSDADRLHRLFDASWEYTMKEFPEFATSVGYPGQNDRWTDVSFEAIARRDAPTRKKSSAQISTCVRSTMKFLRMAPCR